MGTVTIPLIPAAGEIHKLTQHERVILSYIGWGLRDEEIAALLSRSAHTVRSHIQNLKRVLQVQRREILVIVAREALLHEDVKLPGVKASVPPQPVSPSRHGAAMVYKRTRPHS